MSKSHTFYFYHRKVKLGVIMLQGPQMATQNSSSIYLIVAEII